MTTDRVIDEVVKLVAAALLVAALALLAGCAGSLVAFVNADREERVTVTGVVYRPEGAGPFPAVVLLHGCHGVLPATHDWARWFRERGYLALVVDSWAPRGIPTGFRLGCRADEPETPPRERFADALGALAFLQDRADVDAARVGVIGWSNGGAFAIGVVSANRLAQSRTRGIAVPEPGYRASVAVYPGGCRSARNSVLTAPLLILMGEADDWTLPNPCVEAARAMRERGGDATIVLYPGVYHYFDVEGLPRRFLPDVGNDNRPDGAGATVGYDAAAEADARRRVADFFSRHMGGGLR